MTKTSAPGPITGSGPYTLCAPEARKYILFAAILASGLGFIDGSMVAIALPGMRNSLVATLVQAQWISNAYMLTLSALILVGGAIGDRFGLARVFAGGIALFVVASIACALAPTPQFLIVARAIQGIGAAFMVPGSLALISRAYPPEERGRAIGIWAASSAITAALGPIIGGLALTFGTDDTWRWIFAINLPLGGLALYVLWSKIEQDPAQPERGVDIQGGILATLGLGLIAWALTGAEHGNLVDGKSLAIAGAGLLAMGAFLWTEATSPHPMMPLSLFKNLRFTIANVVSFFIYFSFSTISMYLPMAVVGGWNVTEIEVSAAYAPLSFFIASLSGLSGKMADRYGPAPLLVTGSLVLTAGYASLSYVAHTQNFWGAVMPAMCLQGIGMALVVAPLSTAVMGSVESHKTGTASGVNNAVTRMAGLISVATMGSVIAVTYGAAGGGGSFGEASELASHAPASNAAFARFAAVAAALCAISAVISVFSGTTGPSKRKAEQDLSQVIS
ncbi:MFS transporter [uncultured Litoreibacter sp.]|uniref:MFS transporter n=1 Tax=uncultured Litoreibacter sp. TaxID=1392394 RepID=UPI00262DEB5C|nr:MFS transporter [uncultured Litoreibacter sp.]